MIYILCSWNLLSFFYLEVAQGHVDGVPNDTYTLLLLPVNEDFHGDDFSINKLCPLIRTVGGHDNRGTHSSSINEMFSHEFSLSTQFFKKKKNEWIEKQKKKKKNSLSIFFFFFVPLQKFIK